MYLAFRVLLLFLLATTNVLADEVSHRDAAKRFLEAVQYERDLRMMSESMRPILEESMNPVPDVELSSDQQERYDEYVAGVQSLIEEFLGLDVSMEKAIQSYMNVFNEDELNMLAEFFESPLGNLYTERVPELSQKIIQDTSQDAAELMDQIAELSSSFLASIREDVDR